MAQLEPSVDAVEGLGKFYDYLWEHNEGWVYLPTKDPETESWKKTLFEWPKHRGQIVKYTLEKSAEGKEVYVAPAMFNAPSPTKDNVKGSNVLWVEFDGNAPVEWGPQDSEAADGLPVAPEPSLRVCSSREGHEHCYWKLAEFDKDIEWVENVNRSLAYNLKADTSGWDANQVLRPPFTINYKHDLPVHIAAARAVGFSKSDFKDFKNVKQIVTESIEINDIPPISKVIAKYPWDDHHSDLFFKGIIEEGKRSSALMALGYFGAESGMSDEEIYSVLMNADDRWGKFKNRNDRQKRLLDIINRARQKYPVGLNTAEGMFRGLLADDTDVQIAPKQIWGFDEFNKAEVKVEWVMEGLLEQNGMIVVVSGPGVGKTQLSLQFAISCVLGRDFLKWKPTRKQRILFLSLEMGHAALKHFTSDMAQRYSETDLEELDRHLKIAPIGEPLPLDNELGRTWLDAIIEEYKPDGIIIDSMGKVSNSSLTDEEKIKTLNAFYARLKKKYGVFIFFIHHNRKATDNNKKPTTLDDVYGNQYIAAETSTALNLWRTKDMRGSEPVIEITELKNRLSRMGKPFNVVRGEHLFFEMTDPLIDPDKLAESIDSGPSNAQPESDTGTRPEFFGL